MTEAERRARAIEIARKHGFTCIEPPPLINMERAIIAAIMAGMAEGETWVDDDATPPEEKR